MSLGPPGPGESGIYACPACRRRLLREAGLLRCPVCPETYPIRGNIPDFVREKLSQSADPVLRRMRAIDRMARIYETRLWYPVVLNLFCGWRSPSLAQLIASVSRAIGEARGRVLDVACGPGTFGRRMASPSREVFGIDVSERMLRQGEAYAARAGIAGVHFARARVEALPFEGGVFDAALCCGSLHLFADAGTALREVARVMKPGAFLAAYTFTPGSAGILKFRGVREWFRRNQGLRVFGLAELEALLGSCGFEGFRPEVSGSALVFSARRRTP